jgi:hypothetical protein
MAASPVPFPPPIAHDLEPESETYFACGAVISESKSGAEASRVRCG